MTDHLTPAAVFRVVDLIAAGVAVGAARKYVLPPVVLVARRAPRRATGWYGLYTALPMPDRRCE